MSENTQQTVIILNGTSSAGKSSVAQALQQEFLKKEKLFMHFQMDTIWDMLPEGVSAGDLPNKVSTIFDSAKALTQNGHNVVMDIVCPVEPLQGVKTIFNDCNVVLVGVYADLDVLQTREKDRGDRDIGLAESQSGDKGINHGIQYDVVVDTSDKTSEQSAQYLMASLNALR